jgi:FdhD protein
MTDASSHPVSYVVHNDAESTDRCGTVPVEERITLYVNGEPLVGMMCTPTQLEELALGFLFNEGLIERLDQVAVVELCGGGRCVDVWLEHAVEAPSLRTITSGCSGGTTYEDVVGAHHEVHSDLCITAAQASRLMGELQRRAATYRRAGGIHVAGLAEGDRLLCVTEDIGRHNALDKIAGLCLREGHPLRNSILLTSGRVSSEMVQKAARMRVPILISRTSPTSLSVRLAEGWGITLIGYARRRSLRVYTGEQRILGAAKTARAKTLR